MPHVIEPAAGATRTMMAFLLAAYDEEEVRGETRTVLRLHPRLAPYKVAVLPLSKKDELTGAGPRGVRRCSPPHFMCDYDETQSIGRRYRRQDEIGTPLCVTVDFDSLEDRAVTVRERDSMEQVRVPIDDLVDEIDARLGADADASAPGVGRRGIGRATAGPRGGDRGASRRRLGVADEPRAPCTVGRPPDAVASYTAPP